MDSKNPKFISNERYPIPFSLLILSFLRVIGFEIIFIVAFALPIIIPILLIKLGVNNILLLLLSFIFCIIITIIYMRKASGFETRQPLESIFGSIHSDNVAFVNFCLSPVRKWISMNIVCYKCKGQIKDVDLVRNPMRLFFVFKVHCDDCKKGFLLGTGIFDRTLRLISDEK